MDILTLALLIVAGILLFVQMVFVVVYRGRYIQLQNDTHNLNRALNIARNKLIDSERERKWLNHQMDTMSPSPELKNIDLLNKIERGS
jgi:uncharacterized membrane protein